MGNLYLPDRHEQKSASAGGINCVLTNTFRCVSNMRRYCLTLSVWIFIGFSLYACSTDVKIPAKGDFLGNRVDTTVDSTQARYYIENYLSGKGGDPPLTSEINALHRAHEQALPSGEDLRIISRKFSVDFASLYFAHRLLANDCNRELNQSFSTFQNDRLTTKKGNYSNYVVLFVPGWDYQDNGAVTGADFSKPRMLSTDFGLENHLVQLPPTGSVEQNAAVLAREIAKYSALNKKLILVGASSAGPAIHLVLAEQLKDRDLHSVKAWLNLGGILQGSPLVDHYNEKKSWLINPVLWFMGWEKEAILSMSSKRSQERFSRLRIEGNILIINYLGVPLSGQLSKYTQDKYPILSVNGPNDGLTMLSDAIAPKSLTIVALGSDHFFAEDPKIDEKTIALMKLILARLEGDIKSHCIGSPLAAVESRL